jgi:hypothetical protein
MAEPLNPPPWVETCIHVTCAIAAVDNAASTHAALAKFVFMVCILLSAHGA